MLEDVARLKEENRKLTDKYRIAGQAELEDQERSSGSRMQANELIRRLCLCNSNLRVLDGTPGNVALYLPKTGQQIEEDGIDPAKSEFFNTYKYVGGFPLEPVPEFSHVILDHRGLPKRELRGWRTVLMMLIKSRAISYQAAVKQFGEANDQRGSRWHQELHNYR